VRTAGQVLVVEEDAANLDEIRYALQRDGYSVIATASAGGALDTVMNLWERQPDAILLDAQLSDAGGQDFAELYHLLPVRHAPIILLAAPSADAAAAEATGRIQAEYTLVKPFNLDDLLHRVHQLTLPGGAEPRRGTAAWTSWKNPWARRPFSRRPGAPASRRQPASPARCDRGRRSSGR
jgi:CheY-like chemotaxis protein